METVMLPYDNTRFLEITIPAANFAGVFSSKTAGFTGNLEQTIRGVLEHPTGSASLRELAKNAKHILLVVDDNTRRTPVHEILPVMADIFAAAGRDDADIRILFAAGTHRPMTGEEKTEKLGAEMLRRYRHFEHDYLGDCISFGATKYGTPVEVNSLLGWSDLTIAIGSILPHPYCGWAGGGKMILPGVSSAKSILATHMLPFWNQDIGIGVVENQARTEIDEACRMAGLRFIVNSIMNAKGEIVDIVAGDPVAAHRLGIEKAIDVLGVPVPAADLVFGSAYPEHANYWQACKAFHSMEITVKPGGLAVMVAAMPEGRGEHPTCYDDMGETEPELVRRLEALKDKDFDAALTIACALGDRKLFRKARVGIVSEGIPLNETGNGAFLRFATCDEAVALVLREKPDAKIVCFLNTPELLAMVKG